MVKTAPAGTPDGAATAAEGDLLADLRHSHLIPLLDRISHSLNGVRVEGFSAGWVDGPGLGPALGPVPSRIAAFGDVLDAVAYLHRRGVLHLDLKPRNAIVTRDGAVLLDLGSARRAGAPGGRAGGTIGYAAPEVLEGGAASSLSDVFSLGVVLYELCAGRLPWTAEDPEKRCAQVLGGLAMPLAEAAPDLPERLIRLVDAMVRRDAAARPSSADEVRAALVTSGFELRPSDPGDPPFVGRSLLASRLEAAVRSGRPVALVGERGSGRSRLARRLVCAMQAAGRMAWNLSGAADLRVALLQLVGSPGGAPATSLPESPLEAEQPAAGAIPVFLGRWEELGDAVRARMEAAVSSIAAAGLVPIVAREDDWPLATSLRIEPLDEAEAIEVAAACGIDAPHHRREIALRSGGNPGRVIESVRPHTPTEDGLSAGARAALDALRTLPSPIPPGVVATLPPAIRSHVVELLGGRRIRTVPDGGIAVARPGQGPIDPTLHDAVRDAIHDATDPLWAAIAAARLGDWDAARKHEPSAAERARETGRWHDLFELSELLVAAGDRQSVARWARAGMGIDPEAVGRRLSAIPDRTAEEVELLAEALRRAGRLDEAESVANAALAAGTRRTGLLLVVARARAARMDLDGAHASLADALALDGGVELDPEMLGLSLRIATHRLERGDTNPEADSLLARVDALDEVTLPGATLSAAGWLRALRGDFDRGVGLLERATARAHSDGDDRLAVIAGTKLGGALRLRGDLEAARRALERALATARGMGHGRSMLRVLYSLASLEREAGRRTDFERRLAEFRSAAAEAGGADAAEAMVRGALLEAELCLFSGDPAGAVRALGPVDVAAQPAQLRTSLRLVLAEAALESGDPERAAGELLDATHPDGPQARAWRECLDATAQVALGRRRLERLRLELNRGEATTGPRLEGRILLAGATDDLDPHRLTRRREEVDRALDVLEGAVPERLLDLLLPPPVGGAASLDAIAEVLSAVHDLRRFPAALARVVREAVGAHRVLIMVRIPGLGRQVAWKELSGEEASGLGDEVMKRVRRPDDVWASGNAFADPAIRDASETVRTFRLKSLLAVAIPAGDQVIGALYVDDLHRTNRFGDTEARALQRIAALAGELVSAAAATPSPGATPFEPVERFGIVTADRTLLDRLDDVGRRMTAEPETNLLLTGPTGAGKTVLAHHLATEVLGLDGVEEVMLRKVDTNMLVSLLAGAKAGEFTGARERTGAISRAIQGRKALLLDEVQNLDEDGQGVLLPLLDRPRRFGGLTASTRPIQGPLHIILATNADVGGTHWDRWFRPDLWYRMSRLQVALPPLARCGPAVVYEYLRRLFATLGLPEPERALEPIALQRMTHDAWPGNLRQLHAVAEALRARSDTLPLGLADLASCGIGEAPPPGTEPDTLDDAGDGRRWDRAAKVGVVMAALEREGWVQSRAARRLGMSRASMSKFLTRHGLQPEVSRRKAIANPDSD